MAAKRGAGVVVVVVAEGGRTFAISLKQSSMYASTYSEFHVSLPKPGLIFLSSRRISSRNRSRSADDNAGK